MIDFGYFALCLALLTSGYALLSSLAGGRSGRLALVRSAENAMLATCLLLTLAVCVLWHALLTHNFQVRFVAENSNLAMPFFYTITSLWGGQAGSLLFWGWLWGIVGALLSIPIAAAIKIVCENIKTLHPISVMMGSGKTFQREFKDS